MAQIAQYEAPQSITEGLKPSQEGVNAIQTTSEQLRRVAINTASIGHQIGQELDKGLTELGQGVTSMQKAKEKADKQAQNLAATQGHSDLLVNQTLRNQKTLKDADPLDTQVAERIRLQNKKERDDFAASIPDPEIRAEFQKKNAQEDLADVHTSIAIQSRRAVNAVNLTLDKTQANNLLRISEHPSEAAKIIAQEPDEMKRIVSNFPGLDADVAQKLATEHTHERQGQMALKAIESAAKLDPEATREQLKEGGAMRDFLKYLDPQQTETALKMPDYWEKQNRATKRADREDQKVATNDRDDAFIEEQVGSLYAGTNDDFPRNVAAARAATLDAIHAGKITPTVGNKFIGALDNINQGVEKAKEEDTFNKLIVKASPDYDGPDKITSASQVWAEVTRGNISFKRGKEFVETFLKTGKSDPDFARQATDWRKWGQQQLASGPGDINGAARANEFARWYDQRIKTFGTDTSKFELNGPFYNEMVAKIKQLKHPANQPAIQKPDPGTPEAKGRPSLGQLLWGGGGSSGGSK